MRTRGGAGAIALTLSAALLAPAPAAAVPPGGALTATDGLSTLATASSYGDPAVRATARRAARRVARVQGWRRELDHRAARHRGQRLVFRRTFETVGLSWEGGVAPRAEVRTRTEGVWTHWQEIDALGEHASEPLWVGPSTAVEVRVDRFVTGLTAVLVAPGERAADATAGTSEGAGTTGAGDSGAAGAGDTGESVDAALSVTTTLAYAAAAPREEKRQLRHAPAPRMIMRSDWGANERWRGSKPVYLDAIKQAHVHHTAGSTSYRRRDVPGILRSLLWYHTKQLGWSDIGYNFLVDRFGRVWEGRYGGVRQKVRGAHTLGFNHVSFGVAAIGNFEKATPSKRLRGGLVKLIAWKLDVANRNPRNKSRIWSSGSDRFTRGARPRLPNVDGHRDTNFTACPGANLYDRLPGIRVRAGKRANRWNF